MRQLARPIVVLSLLLGGCSPNPATTSQGHGGEQTAITPGGTPSPYKTQGEAEAAAVKALSGDADAAWGVFLYFTGEPFDRDRASYWMQIAVENGSPNALYYAAKLSASDDACKALRGVYYLELALKFTPESDTQHSASLRTEIASARERVAKMSGSDCLRVDTRLHM